MIRWPGAAAAARCRDALLVLSLTALAAAPASAQEGTARVSLGTVMPGLRVAVAHGDRTEELCAPLCSLEVPWGSRIRAGFARDGAGPDWTEELRVDQNLRLDVRLGDRSLLRGAGHALLIATGVLLLASAIVGIATEPTPPDLGWFGPSHGLVFAGIAGAIVLVFGVPGVALALGYERDAPTILPVPEG